MNNFPSVLESINDLNQEQIVGLLALARKFKDFSNDWQGLPVPFIKTPIIATSFLENSTRTKNSFAVAIHKLGATYIDFNAEMSSLKKGESLEETLLTLQSQGVDLCIMRTSVSGQFQEFKESAPIKIVNAGDGTNEHPTQALLDLFTMQEIGLGFEGKTVAIVGDNIHSRVGHSLINLLPMFGIKIILCGPKEYLPKEAPAAGVTLSSDIEETIAKSDLLYLLRIQKERHNNSDTSIYDTYAEKFGVSVERLNNLGKKLPVFHPGPANVGVEISHDLVKSPLYFGYDQVQNSVYMRMAIVQAILQNNDKTVGVNFDNRKITDL